MQGPQPLLVQRLFDKDQRPHRLPGFWQFRKQRVELFQHQRQFLLVLALHRVFAASLLGLFLDPVFDLGFQHDLQARVVTAQGKVVLEKGGDRVAQRVQ